jgi:NitT/TauT family transport system permease protein
VWQFICSVWQVSDFIFPSPASILQAMVDYAGPITEHALSTFWVTMVGFAIAVVVGVTLGFVIGSSPMLYAAAYPLMTAFNACPRRLSCRCWWSGSASARGRPS